MALWQIRVILPDTPGRLADLGARLAELPANILALQVHVTGEHVVDDLVVDVPSHITESAIVEAVLQGGGRQPVVRVAHTQALVDMPTRALRLAGQQVMDPVDITVLLADLLDADEVRWRPGDQVATGYRPGETVMSLPDPDGGVLVARREGMPFTPTEFARARAAVDMMNCVETASMLPRTVVILPDGAEVTLRRCGVSDTEQVWRMHNRCSPESLAGRYGVDTVPDREWIHRLLGHTAGYALGAETSNGAIVALGTLLIDGQEAEVGILVEDAMQRRRLATAILRRLAVAAGRAGVEKLHARFTPADPRARTLLNGLNLPTTSTLTDGVLTVTVQLPKALPDRAAV